MRQHRIGQYDECKLKQGRGFGQRLPPGSVQHRARQRQNRLQKSDASGEDQRKVTNFNNH